MSGIASPRGRRLSPRQLLPIAAKLRGLGLGSLGLVLTLTVIGIAAFGPLLAPDAPTDLVGVPFQAPDGDALLGTDALGRDALSRVLYGGQHILLLSAIATVIGVTCGGLMGIAAGYLKGWTDETIMRLSDVAMAFPQTMLALLFLSIIGPNLFLVSIIVAIIHAPQVARVARAATMRIAGDDFVLYAEAIGLSHPRVLVQELLPNILPVLLVELGLRFTYSIAIIAGLSFLGVAEQPPAADWGLMINENRIGLGLNPWPVVVPVLLIGLLTIGMNLFTDAISRRSSGQRQTLEATDPVLLADSATQEVADRDGLT